MEDTILRNPILDTDSYKSSHWLQYPPGTTKLIAYLESRGGEFDTTVFFGLQYFLKQYLSRRITEKHVKEAEAFFSHHKLPFNTEGWMYIVKRRKGKIPLLIHAAPEGSVVPTKNILMRVESTDANCYWVTTWFETMLLRVWYPITVATLSYHSRKLLHEHLLTTSDSADEEIGFKLHDFGARGVSSRESAGIGGAAHLVNFSGSDTIMGMLYANAFYKAQLTPSSIPAAEHSCIVSWGKDKEEEAFRTILHELSKKSPLIALPADSYDTTSAVANLWGDRLKEAVKKSGVTLVIRTDSGHPPTVVLQTLQSLEKTFGATKNKKGYKVLNNVRVLHSDQINREMIGKILDKTVQYNYSASNLVFGMGGALLQQIDRDTLKFAYKVSEIEIEGKAKPVYKDPKTATGKKSKAGYLDLVLDNGEYKTVLGKSINSQLVKVFENGKILKEYTFEEVRKRAWPIG